jgi:hypothetical protein
MGLDLHPVSSVGLLNPRVSVADVGRREGIVTVIVGSATFFILPRDPATARFLSTAERQSVSSGLQKDQEFQEEKDEFSWKACFDALKSPQMWLVFAQFFCSGGESSIPHVQYRIILTRQSCCIHLLSSRLVGLRFHVWLDPANVQLSYKQLAIEVPLFNYTPYHHTSVRRSPLSWLATWATGSAIEVLSWLEPGVSV